jgi:hypothetical protein
MIKNDARFFFCFTGFIGFFLFYLIASFMHKNFAFTLVHGAVGCLCFSVCGRFLLDIILTNYTLSSTTSPNLKSNKTLDTPPPITKSQIKRSKTVKSKDSSSVDNLLVDTKV